MLLSDLQKLWTTSATSQNFSAMKIVQIFQKNFLKSTGLGEQLLVRNVFENFDL